MRPTRALALVRIGVGLILVIRTTPVLIPFGFRFAEWPLLGWPHGSWHIAAVPLPAWLVGALAVLRTLAALGFLVGWRARAAGVIGSVAGWLVLAQDALGYVNSLELLYMATLITALADSSAELAVAPEPPGSLESSVWLVRALPLTVYAFSGFAKLNPQFLSGDAMGSFCADGFIRGLAMTIVCGSHARAASIAVACAELSLPVLLTLAKTRRGAVLLAVAFHVGLEVSMHPDVFGWLMLVLLVPFLADEKL